MRSYQSNPGKAKAATARVGKGQRPAAANKPPPRTVAAASTAAPKAGEPAPANSLTPDEQMKLFEKELKENDWGHQPC